MKENILDYYDEYVIFVILYFCFSSALIIFTMVDFFYLFFCLFEENYTVFTFSLMGVN